MHNPQRELALRIWVHAPVHANGANVAHGALAMGGGAAPDFRQHSQTVLTLGNLLQGGRDGDAAGGGASMRYAGAGGDPFGDVEEDEGASGNPGLSDLLHTGGTAERTPVTTPPLM